MSDANTQRTAGTNWLASAEFRRRLFVTVLALAAFQLGHLLPLYGLNGDVWKSISGASPMTAAALARLSIFAIGITPFLSAVLIWEALRLCIPPLRRWANGAAEVRTIVQRVIVAIAILFAMFQARGMTVAMADITGLVSAPDTTFQLVARLELIGGALVCIGLVRLIDRHGLGSGLLLLLSTLAVIQISNLFSDLSQLSAMGQTPEGYGYLLALYLILSIGALLLMDRRRVEHGKEHRFNAGGPWPILLGSTGFSAIFLCLALAISLLRITVKLPESFTEIGLALIAGLTVVFAILMALAERDETGGKGTVSQTLLQGAVSGAILAAIFLAGQWLLYAGQLPLLIQGANVAIIVIAIRRIFEPPASWTTGFDGKSQAV